MDAASIDPSLLAQLKAGPMNISDLVRRYSPITVIKTMAAAYNFSPAALADDTVSLLAGCWPLDFLEREMDQSGEMAEQLLNHVYSSLIVVLSTHVRLWPGIQAPIEKILGAGIHGVAALTRHPQSQGVRVVKAAVNEGEHLSFPRYEANLRLLKPLSEEQPHMARILEFGRIELDLAGAGTIESVYEINEFIAGNSVATVLARADYFGAGLPQLIDIVLQCLALQHFLVGKNQVLEDGRNLDNLLIDEHGVVKLVDFGGAVPLRDALSNAVRFYLMGAETGMPVPGLAGLLTNKAVTLQDLLRAYKRFAILGSIQLLTSQYIVRPIDLSSLWGMSKLRELLLSMMTNRFGADVWGIGSELLDLFGQVWSDDRSGFEDLMNGIERIAKTHHFSPARLIKDGPIVMPGHPIYTLRRVA